MCVDAVLHAVIVSGHLKTPPEELYPVFILGMKPEQLLLGMFPITNYFNSLTPHSIF